MEFDSQALSAMEDPYPVFDAIDPAAETDLFEGLTDPLASQGIQALPATPRGVPK